MESIPLCQQTHKHNAMTTQQNKKMKEDLSKKFFSLNRKYVKISKQSNMCEIVQSTQLEEIQEKMSNIANQLELLG